MTEGGLGKMVESSFCEQKEAKKLYSFSKDKAEVWDGEVEKAWILRFAQDDRGKSEWIKFFCFFLFTKRRLPA